MSETLLKHSRVPRKQDPKALQRLAKAKTRGQLANAKGALNLLAGLDPQTILSRCLVERTADIAQDLGVHRSALNQWLLQNGEDDWKEVQVARALTRKEMAEDELEAAQDPLSLARAREMLRAAQWDLERVCRRIYGQDQNININVGLDLGERLRRARERVIEEPSS